MKLLIEGKLSEPEEVVTLYLRYSEHGVHVCAKNDAGIEWILADITARGIRMIGSVNKRLGFALDDRGRLLVTQDSGIR